MFDFDFDFGQRPGTGRYMTQAPFITTLVTTFSHENLISTESTIYYQKNHLLTGHHFRCSQQENILFYMGTLIDNASLT